MLAASLRETPGRPGNLRAGHANAMIREPVDGHRRRVSGRGPCSLSAGFGARLHRWPKGGLIVTGNRTAHVRRRAFRRGTLRPYPGLPSAVRSPDRIRDSLEGCWKGFEPSTSESKSDALPLSYPMEQTTGIEPATSGRLVRRSTTELGPQTVFLVRASVHDDGRAASRGRSRKLHPLTSAPAERPGGRVYSRRGKGSSRKRHA